MRLLLIFISALSLSSCITTKLMKVRADLGDSALIIDPVYDEEKLTMVNFDEIEVCIPVELTSTRTSKKGLLRRTDSLITDFITTINMLHCGKDKAVVEILSKYIHEIETETLLSSILKEADKPSRSTAHRIIRAAGSTEETVYNTRVTQSITIRFPGEDEWNMHLFHASGEKKKSFIVASNSDTIKVYIIKPSDKKHVWPIGYEFDRNNSVIATVQCSYGYERLWLSRDISAKHEFLISALAYCIWKYRI